MISITRVRESRELLRGGWIIVYGRRKTGKTYLVLNTLKYDKYFFVGKDGSIYEDFKRISYDGFKYILSKLIREEKTIVVDEFHRLPEDFLDLIHLMSAFRKCNLVLVTSTLHLFKKIIGKKSPIMGLFHPIRVDLISEKDILLGLKDYVKDPKKLIEYATYLREPWLILVFEKAPEEFFESMLENIKFTVPALIGEIFDEEDRELSRVYHGVLRALADGKETSKEISDYLASLGLIKPDPSLVYPYLKNLCEIGLVEKMKVYGKGRYRFKHVSPVLDLYYYIDAKYAYSERNIPREMLIKIFKEKLPRHVEHFFRNLLADIFKLTPEIILEKNLEVDIALTEFKKVKVVCEVKWRSYISRAYIDKIEENLSRFKDCRKILIVPDRSVLEKEPKTLEVWTPEHIIQLIE